MSEITYETIVRQICDEAGVTLDRCSRTPTMIMLRVSCAAGWKSMARFTVTKDYDAVDLSFGDNLIDELIAWCSDWSTPNTVFEHGDTGARMEVDGIMYRLWDDGTLRL